MPQAQQTRLQGRRLTDPRDTMDWTTPNLQPAARPVDVQNTVRGSKLSQLVDALSSVNQGLEQFRGAVDNINEHEYQKGQEMRAAGKELKSSWWATVRGYEEMDGKIKANQEYQQAVADFVTQNAETMSKEEFEEGLFGLSKQFINGGSDNFQRGFVKEALSIEEGALNAYQSTQAKLFERKVLDQANARFQHVVDRVSQATVKKIVNDKLLSGEMESAGLEDFETMLSRPDIYQILDTGNYGQTFATELRTALDEEMKQFKQIGMSVPAISEVFLDRVGQVAVEKGLPELLDYATLKDSAGISVEDTALGDKVKAYRDRAQSQREALVNAMDRKAEAARSSWQKQMKNIYQLNVATVETMDDQVQAAVLAGQYLGEIIADPNLLEIEGMGSIMANLQAAQQGGGNFPPIGDEQVYADFLLADAMETLDINAISTARNAKLLSLDQYKDLTNRWSSLQDKKQARAEKPLPWVEKEQIDKIMNATIDMLSEKDISPELKNLFTPETLTMLQGMGELNVTGVDREAKNRITILFAEGLHKWRTEHPDRMPNLTEFFNEIYDPVTATMKKWIEGQNGPPKPTDEELAIPRHPVMPSSVQQTPATPSTPTKPAENPPAQQARGALGWSGMEAERAAMAEAVQNLPKTAPDDPKKAPIGGWDYGYTFDQINLGLSEGMSKEEIVTQMVDKGGQTTAAVNDYFANYLVRKAKALLAGKTSEEEVRKKFEGWGFADEEINNALEWATK